jgi:WhiB family redox-sensing transcriptional regulator
MGNWRDLAACRDEDPELFFPIGTGPAADADAQRAKAVCRSCPVREQCLTFALSSGQDSGVWGGLTEEERRALRRGEIQVTTSRGVRELGK